MPTNVRYSIKVVDITNLDKEIEKAYVIEESMLESNIDPKFLLGKV